MIRIRQIKIEALTNSKEKLKEKIARKLRINPNEIKSFSIYRQSIDARNKESIFFVYEVNVEVKNEEKILKNQNDKDIFPSKEETYTFKSNKKLKQPPIIVGSGPSGLFAALILAENNNPPIIIERGEKIEERIEKVTTFWEKGRLDESSNVQFGEGGAGTFSDGKLNTLIRNQENRMTKVFETFVRFGAPKEILYSYKPHIGTDILREVIIKMREYIKSLGGVFLYKTCLTDLCIENKVLKGVIVNHEKYLPCKHLILAIGHSARDTFKLLYDKKVDMTSKAFAVGVRVIHAQEKIDASLVGEKYKKTLSPATYKLTHTCQNKRGVYSFCMCPGGYVVNASSQKGALAINGMSNYKRDSGYANSALVVTVDENDFGPHPLDGMAFQNKLEKKAFLIGKGNIPCQTLKDFKEQKSEEKMTIEGIKGAYTFADLNTLFPEEITKSLKEAFPFFEKKIKNFAEDKTILAGVESRTSSPVRIIRNKKYESNIIGIFPTGEGAGYAGGITSSAVDGIKVAESLLENES